jgi:hypothetical protein
MPHSRKNFSLLLPLSFSLMLGLGATAGIAQAQNAAPDQNTTQNTAPGAMSAPAHPKHERLSHKKVRHVRSARLGNRLKGEEFKSEAAAKAHCPTQTVVWVNTHGRVFHMPRSKYYGKTRYGAYACEKAAEAAGFHASKY